jgi:sulfopyruvate decarboxylase subunit alpha
MIMDLFRELGVSHVVTVPDNTSAPILAALEGVGAKAAPGDAAAGHAPEGAAAEAAPEGAAAGHAPEGAAAEEAAPVRLLYATREGEAVALASGLWVGGACPVVLIQNTGLLESGDGLRGTASRMGAPLLLLVTLRGYREARALGVEPGKGVSGREGLVRPELDSAALMTEGTLQAWGIPFFHVRDGSDLSPVRDAWRTAVEEQRPVAVLLEGPVLP